jgi:7-carboxy-7-deazaguanine synthase
MSEVPLQSRRLRITEIFHSLQGETSTVGLPTVFVRLTGCPLRCQYCDTAYAFSGGELVDVAAIVERVASYATRHVTVTGGEPLAQPVCLTLLRALADAGFATSLETSGALDIGGVDPRIVRIVDIKTPGSGEVERNRWENIALLQRRDQIKFVICDARDYDWARQVVERHELTERVGEVLFSPSYGQLALGDLAEWILRDRLGVRLQIQLHKILWGDEPGR